MRLPILFCNVYLIMCHVESITIGASLSEVHTSRTALQDVLLMRGHIPKMLTEQTDTFQIYTC